MNYGENRSVVSTNYSIVSLVISREKVTLKYYTQKPGCQKIIFITCMLTDYAYTCSFPDCMNFITSFFVFNNVARFFRVTGKSWRVGFFTAK